MELQQRLQLQLDRELQLALLQLQLDSELRLELLQLQLEPESQLGLLLLSLGAQELALAAVPVVRQAARACGDGWRSCSTISDLLVQQRQSPTGA